MKRNILTIVFLAVALLSNAQDTFTLTSSDISGQAENKQVFNSMGCTGENKSPQLKWVNAPEGTKSFAITMYDKDAPTGSGLWHWMVSNIPGNISELPTAAGDVTLALMPEGAIQSMNDLGGFGYVGPCPPEGDRPHLYIITVYALKVAALNIDKNTSPALLGFMLNSNAIQKASIVFYYQR